MTTLQRPKLIRATRAMTTKELQVALSHVMRLLLHQANRLTLSEDERNYHFDAVLAALAGWSPAPYASMDDREAPDDDDGPASPLSTTTGR